MKARRLLASGLCLLGPVFLGLAGTSHAQVSTASIVGRVVDQTGAVISGAKVTATQTQTSIGRTVSTAADGLFTIPLLPVGPYSLRASAAGFADFQQTGIVLTVGQVANIPIVLRLGNVNQKVTVSANATMLNTTDSETVQLINQKTVEAVPLNGRNPSSLQYLTGGVGNPVQNGENTNATDAILQAGYPSESVATIHGIRSGGVYYSLDGANNVDPYNVAAGPFPNPDMIREFNIVTGNFGARYASAPGGAVNIVTKSGTNQIHGDAFEFIRNGSVNARNFFAQTVDPLKRNQYGGDLGGPILHDRWFIFGGYQRTHITDSSGGHTQFVPTAAERKGDFSSTATPIFNPATGLPFPSNSSIGPLNPVIQKLLAYVPLPTNLANDSLVYSLPELSTENSYVVRTDFTHGNHRVFGRFFYDHFLSPPQGIQDNNIFTSQPGGTNVWTNATVGDTWVRGNFMSDARFSYITVNDHGKPGQSTVTLPGLGAQITQATNPTIQLFQTIGAFNITNGNTSVIKRTTYEGSEDIMIQRGRNQISFGASYQRLGSVWNSDNEQNGIPVFTGQATGNVMADILLGKSDYFVQADGLLIKAAGNLAGFYGQDKFRATNRLTLTVGLRWDPYWPFHSLGNRISCYIPGQKSGVFINAPRGVVYPGDPNCNSSGTNGNNLGNVEPRIGFAEQLGSSGKTVLRGGYGIYTMQFPFSSFLAFGSAQPFERLIEITPPAVSISDPYANFPGGNPFANGFELNLNPRPKDTAFVNPSINYAFSQNFRLPSVQSWSLVVEQSLTNDDFLSVGYYGSIGRHLSVIQDDNQAIYIPGESSPFNIQERRPNPEVAAAYDEHSIANSSYNGLEVVYRHRVRGGVTLSADFDWAKSMDDFSAPGVPDLEGPSLLSIPNDPGFRYAPSDFNQAHTLRAIGVWDLPWFAKSTGIERAALGGWQFSGLFTWDSGFPFSISTGAFGQSFTGNLTELADRVPGVSTGFQGNRSQSEKIAEYFNTAAFTVNGPGTYGDSGRNILTSPDNVDIDASVVKGFQVRERLRINLRVDAFNALNHTQFLPPVNDLGGGGYGELIGARDPRILQGAIKLVF